jgi:glycosyltransferase involved in cell wall biosynthesis
MAKKINAKVVIASRGMLQQEALNQKKWKKKIYTTLLKTSRILDSVTWHSTNTNETEDIYRTFNAENINMISNVPIVPNNNSKKIESQKSKLVSVSLNTEMKNIHFLIEVLKDVKQQINYDIYGPIKDKDYWQRCEAIIDTLPENIKVEYKGEIDPDKIGDVLPNYNLFVLPTLGENFGHAIFEAFANGIPVLISDRTPWRNLEKQNIGFDLDLDKNIWTEKINSLNIEQLNNMRNDAYNFAKHYFKNGNFKNQYLKLFNN